MTTHDCPGGCGTQVPQRQLACKPCWFRLPRALRDAVNNAYQRRAKDPTAHKQAIRIAYQWYQNNPRKDVQTA